MFRRFVVAAKQSQPTSAGKKIKLKGNKLLMIEKRIPISDDKPTPQYAYRHPGKYAYGLAAIGRGWHTLGGFFFPFVGQDVDIIVVRVYYITVIILLFEERNGKTVIVNNCI